MIECETCNGEGFVDCDESECVNGHVDCGDCDGSGEDVCSHCGQEIKCDNCEGTGEIDCEYCCGTGEMQCPDCGGNGEIEDDEDEDEDIEPGAGIA